MALETADQASRGGSRPHGPAFAPTQWSIVLAAGAASSATSSEAMEQLCRVYWPPIFAHLRFKGYPLHQAQDLAQEFFARLLQSNAFASVSPEKGRFRTFLLAALKHFLINEWKRGRTLKRGGAVVVVDLDGLDSAVRDACEPRSEDDPTTAYDRQWALTVIAKVRSRLRKEYEAAGQLDRHDALKFHLMDASGPVSCADTAARLDISESAAKSAIHRIRQRFGQLLRAEITRTVSDEGDVDDEIRHLLGALRS